MWIIFFKMSKMALYWFCSWKKGVVLYAKGSCTRDVTVRTLGLFGRKTTHWRFMRRRDVTRGHQLSMKNICLSITLQTPNISVVQASLKCHELRALEGQSWVWHCRGFYSGNHDNTCATMRHRDDGHIHLSEMSTKHSRSVGHLRTETLLFQSKQRGCGTETSLLTVLGATNLLTAKKQHCLWRERKHVNTKTTNRILANWSNICRPAGAQIQSGLFAFFPIGEEEEHEERWSQLVWKVPTGRSRLA